jgi:GxxExxY protein
MSEIQDQVSYTIIGKAMETHRELGPGLDEMFYHELLAAKLVAAGIPHEKKPRGQLMHRGVVADVFEADFIFGNQLAAELKVLWGDFVPEHVLQVVCYLKFWKLSAGLLFDFGKESLAQKRIPLLDSTERVESSGLLREVPDFADRATITILVEAIQSVLDTHGLGYRDTTYQGLLFAELAFRGVPCLRDPISPIRGAQGLLGESKLKCLLLPGVCALLVTALRDSRHAADRAVLQTYLRHLELPWGLHINFGKRQMDFQFTIKPKR